VREATATTGIDTIAAAIACTTLIVPAPQKARVVGFGSTPTTLRRPRRLTIPSPDTEREGPPDTLSTVKKFLLFVATIVVSGALVAGAVVVAGPQLVAIASAGSGEPQPIDTKALDGFAVRSQVLASDGSPLATLHGVENRSPIALSQVPQPVVQSILAVEDAEFYDHRGINARALARALVENVSAGGVEQGGSTITQQLVKNALLTNERSLERKAKEAVLALRLEEEMSKDQILETYLNTVYFGSGAYGVQAAAETYWGKNVQDLSWAEGAMLASLIANPVSYDPTLHPDRAREQRRIAVERLVSLDFITRADADYIALFPVPTVRCGATADARPDSCGAVKLPPVDSYFVEYVKLALLRDPAFGLGATGSERFNSVFGGGLRIFTTLDPAAQEAANTAQAEKTPRNDVGVVTSFVAVEPATGAVRALVGNGDFKTNQFDVATTEPGRQTGSAFKTFVLLEALEQGALPNDSVSGTISMTDPGTLEPYSVSGTSGTLQSVLAASSNGAFVRLNQVVGPDKVVELAREMGINLSDGSEKKPSLPLGVADTTPLQMATAYSAIPNGGVENPAYFVDRIEDRFGRVLYTHEPEGKRVVSEQTACVATKILEGNVQGGTGTRARLPDQPAAGKTGTTEDSTDVWFVGFTPYLTTAVWLGNPEVGSKPASGRTPLDQISGAAFGGTLAAPVWQRFNELYHESRPSKPFPDCAPPSRGGRPLSGANDPFGTLNGGYDPSGVGVIAGPMKGNRSGFSSGAGSRDQRTNPTDPAIVSPSTVPPAIEAPAPAPAPAPNSPPTRPRPRIN